MPLVTGSLSVIIYYNTRSKITHKKLNLIAQNYHTTSFSSYLTFNILPDLLRYV